MPSLGGGTRARAHLEERVKTGEEKQTRSGTVGGGEEVVEGPSGEERKSQAGRRRQGGKGVAY